MPKDPQDIFDDDLREKVYQSTREKVESLWYASVDGDIERVRAILDEGYHDVNGGNRWQVDMDPNGWSRTPLHAAVLNANVKLAKFLLTKGADPNRRTKYGDTPLHFAVEGGQLEMVRLLLKNGADASVKNDDGDTPLDIAKAHRLTEIISLLRPKPKKA